MKGRKCFIATLQIRKLKSVGEELGLEPYSLCQTTPSVNASTGHLGVVLSLSPFQEDVDSKKVSLS